MSTAKKSLLLATPVVLLCGWFAYDFVETTSNSYLQQLKSVRKSVRR